MEEQGIHRLFSVREGRGREGGEGEGGKGGARVCRRGRGVGGWVYGYMADSALVHPLLCSTLYTSDGLTIKRRNGVRKVCMHGWLCGQREDFACVVKIATLVVPQ